LTLLRRNVDGRNIKVIPYGIGNADTLQPFVAQGTGASSSFIEAVTALNRHWQPDQVIEHVMVTMCKLDTLLNHCVSPNPTVVKIDIEGFEFQALKGATRLLALVRPKILIEIHPYQLALSGDGEDDVFELLSQHGYSWSIIDKNPKNPNWPYLILAEPPPRALP
jgi:FkbM family methyltransferase